MKLIPTTNSFRAGLFAFICLTIPVSRPLFAQAAARDSSAHLGTLSGRVTNKATKAVLEGAHVTLLPSGITTLTDKEGEFIFRAVPGATHSLTFTYTGLDILTLPVTTEGGRNTAIDAQLNAGIYMLESFVVAGEREGSALAITQQRNAPNVKNVLSSDAFGNVADENIGNFLLRVPGISANIQEGEITGLTWTEDPLDITCPNSSVAALGLKSGHWLLAVNDAKGRHVLTAYLSDDEGRTWKWKRSFERLAARQGSGSNPAPVQTRDERVVTRQDGHYPTMIQVADGGIHIVYTHSNADKFEGNTIKHARFDEAWVMNK